MKKKDDLKKAINSDKVKFYIGDVRDYDCVNAVVNTNKSINPFYTRKDAKSLLGTTIASNIAGHKLQLNENPF
jgi:hypothetical protein